MQVELTDKSADDFIRRRVKIRATEDGHYLTWELPRRLMLSSLSDQIVQELIAEFRETFG